MSQMHVDCERPRLRVLVDNAGGITLSTEALKIMCDNLETNNRVQVLTMGFCNIDDKGMTMIANTLTANTTLRTLNLWDNKIGSEGGEQLGHALVRIVFVYSASDYREQLRVILCCECVHADDAAFDG
jgi:Ran GTPase-activating protein (RanGAP) involved in mRNA processing and transport